MGRYGISRFGAIGGLSSGSEDIQGSKALGSICCERISFWGFRSENGLSVSPPLPVSVSLANRTGKPPHPLAGRRRGSLNPPMPPAPTLPSCRNPRRQPPKPREPDPRAPAEPMDRLKRGIAEPGSCRSRWTPRPMAAGAPADARPAGAPAATLTLHRPRPDRQAEPEDAWRIRHPPSCRSRWPAPRPGRTIRPPLPAAAPA